MVNEGPGGGNSIMFYFHPESWGNDPIWRANGLIEIPTRKIIWGFPNFLELDLNNKNGKNNMQMPPRSAFVFSDPKKCVNFEGFDQT